MDITLLPGVQFVQIRMFWKAQKIKFSILLYFKIQEVIRDSELRHNAGYKLTTLSMKLDPTLSILGCLMGI